MKKVIKKIIKSIFILMLFSIIIVAGCIFYGFKIEPYMVKVNEMNLNESSETLSPVKIAQISDIHIKEDFGSENLDKVVSKLNSQNPDIVVFTGDLYDNYAKYHDDDHIIKELSQIQSKYQKIAIWGNRDYGGGAAREYESIMNAAGFTVLKNENLYVTLENNKTILFTALDDALLGQAYMPDDTKTSASDYDILLTHEPDVVDQYKDYSYDLILSGHSHGGQVVVPFVKLRLTTLGEKYVNGFYTVEGSGNQRLYVNTGIGTTHISARFGVVPEISIFDLYL